MKKVLAFILVLLCLFWAGCATAEEELPAQSPTPPASTTLPLPLPEENAASPEISPAPSPETEPEAEPMPEPEQEPVSEVEDSEFVKIEDYIPGVETQLRYATEENFTGKIIYSFNDAYLRYGTCKKLMAVQEELETMGLGVKIWDAFRPVSAQFVLWEVCPNPVYVANPNSGFSSHSRGNTLDITLVDSRGQEMIMPTGFDDFSALADRNYSDCSAQAAENALLLQNIMEKHGFSGYFGEWWHFSDTQSYEVEKQFDPAKADFNAE